MTIVQSPITLIFFITSIIFTLCCPRMKKYGSALPIIGGMCTAAGIIIAFISGATMQEILVFVLGILLVSFYTIKKWEGRVK